MATRSVVGDGEGILQSFDALIERIGDVATAHTCSTRPNRAM